MQYELILEALEIGLDCAIEFANKYHESMQGYRPHDHDMVDADVKIIQSAIDELKKCTGQTSN